MFKKMALIGLLTGGLALAGAYVYLNFLKGEPAVVNKQIEDKVVATSSPTLMLIPEELASPSANVPLISEEDIIRLFFELINEKRVPEAIAMMSPAIAPDDSTRQAWGVQFNDISSVRVQSIEPFWQDQWAENRHTYKVMLEVYVSPEAAKAAIPYYGWGDNPNVRWITIEKSQDKEWQIAAIATGP
jgi:hypothetical protein